MMRASSLVVFAETPATIAAARARARGCARAPDRAVDVVAADVGVVVASARDARRAGVVEQMMAVVVDTGVRCGRYRHADREQKRGQITSESIAMRMFDAHWLSP